MILFGSSDNDDEDGEESVTITYTSRREKDIVTRRFRFVSGETDIISYDERNSKVGGHIMRLRDFNEDHIIDINMHNVETDEVLERDSVAYTTEHKTVVRVSDLVSEVCRIRGLDGVIDVVVSTST